jgi:N-formylglutamate deformylase
MLKVYSLFMPKEKRVPILLSSPHSGTEFPQELAHLFRPEVVAKPEDTDWFVHELYDFAPDLNISLIHAEHSRYVVDLNRDFKGDSLYQDGRFLTGLVPTQTFSKKDLYLKELPSPSEIQRRLKIYYWPYYYKISEILLDLKKEFGYAILFDCHSIKRNVPSISPEPFPDLILGDNDSNSANTILSEVALRTLGENKLFNVSHNNPFKGGHITRWFGKPQENIHALQLEMSQDLYMDVETGSYNELKATIIRERLRATLENLLEISQEIL